MEGEKNKQVVPDPEFDRLIPRPRGITETIKRGAGLEDTIEFLPKAMQRVIWQVKKIAPLLEGDTPEETCYNIWHRLYTRLPYVKDDEGKEQIRSPRATWWQRRADCDDFSVFVSSILCALKNPIPHLFRITKYKEENGYQHIYPVAIMPDGREIIIDCVLSRFNKEVPYLQKIDKEMDLQFLDGVEDEFTTHGIGNIDAQDLLEGDLGELGKKLRDTKLFKKVSLTASKVKDKAKQALHAVNKINPATALLRVGVLACMKINMFNIAGVLRYTYLSDEQAKKKGMNMSKFPKLKAIREKLEKIFFGAGGTTENLKKAILTGKGNQNKDVPLSGLGSLDTNSYDENTRLPKLLGAPLYENEMYGVEGLGELGIATEAAIAAATSAMAALAALIKQLGPLKQGGDNTDPASADTSTSTDAPTTTNTSDGSGGGGSGTSTDANAQPDATAPAGNSNDTVNPTGGGANKETPATATGDDSGDSSGDDNSTRDTKSKTSANNKSSSNPEEKNDGFIRRAIDWAKNNKAAAATIGVAVVAGLGFGGYKIAAQIKAKKKQQPAVPTLSGVPRKRRKKRKGTHSKKIRVQRLR